MSKILAAILCIIAINRVYAQQCGIITGGAVIQQLTDFDGSSGIKYTMDGLFYDSKENKLYFVNRNEPALYCLDGKTAEYNSTEIPNVKYIEAALLIKGDKDKMIAVADNSLKTLILHKDPKGNIISIETEEPSTIIEPNNNYTITDIKFDNKGRLWVDLTTDTEGNGAGELMVIETDKSVKKVLATDKLPTGIGFNSDNTALFHLDADENLIKKYKFDSNAGTITGEPKVVFNMTKDLNLPNKACICSMEVTKSDDFWIGVCEVGLVVYFNTKTSMVTQIHNLPSKFPVNLEMGGPTMSVLFVGTSNEDPQHDTRAAGNVFAISGTGTKGKQGAKIQY